ncbi:hypothetical protein TRFO_02756 [Tritrichomonas foetus]|uniref:Uncharacterized protein n=1 Tax=Tritrichomonas foetus TaxID=1144522 RepID=A0A1J4L3I3_9EUKA|nr:hypothetical protein TRFO_02756 [Tritrichomonas foetus]|eukprot:OHT16477.1 hypothetical protein TRFO_02756 [Tritrichomonas foetus]
MSEENDKIELPAHIEEQEPRRPMTVTFNIPENYTPSQNPRVSFENTPTASHRPMTTAKAYPKVRTADLSHITDHKTTNPGKSFIPQEYIREVQTPTPLRPGTGTLNVDKKTWSTTVFPSEKANSREEVQNLGIWLNQMLAENQKKTDNPLELAANARHWFTIAYDELCREVSVDCPERAKLLASIWKRYQALFQRVIQLHQEERNFLINCHKERTTSLKNELDSAQAQLKQISQQYRDDQERWSNSREREETKFANMRKKLDLQVKNKRNLLIQIKALKEKLENPDKQIDDEADISTAESTDKSTSDSDKNENNQKIKSIENDKNENHSENEQNVTISQQQISDKVHQLRARIKKELPYMYDISMTLDDIAHLVDQERTPSKSTRDLFPSIFNVLPTNHAGKVRKLEWALSCMTYIYSLRLARLSERRIPFEYSYDRTHFIDSIYEQFLAIFGLPQLATETLFDLIETVRGLKNTGNVRCRLFLQFLDAESPYLDSTYLDFYCFCIGSFLVSNTSTNVLFPDVIDEDTTQFSPLPAHLACDLANKVLYSISDADTADKYLKEMKEKLQIDLENSPNAIICADDVLDFLIDTYKKEEERVSEQLHEQFDMDAAQYGGIATFSQFQTLSMFSARKLDHRMYSGMMREIMQKTSNKTMSFTTFIKGMHEYSLLVPFNYDRVNYNTDLHLDDTFNFMKQEFQFHMPEISLLLDRTRKSDDSLFKQLNAAKAKFEQVVETKRTGYFTEVAQRELYELIKSINIDDY